MILPANFVNEIRDEENTEVHFCPYCSRILFYEETEEVPEFVANIESGSLADIGDYAEEGEEETEEEDEESDQDKDDTEKEYAGTKKRKIAFSRDDISDDLDDE